MKVQEFEVFEINRHIQKHLMIVENVDLYRAEAQLEMYLKEVRKMHRKPLIAIKIRGHRNFCDSVRILSNDSDSSGPCIRCLRDVITVN